MISTEKCCFDNWENFLKSNLCASQNNYIFSSNKNLKKVRHKSQNNSGFSSIQILKNVRLKKSE